MLNTLISFSAFYFLTLFEMNIKTSNIISILTGAMVSYISNSIWVFQKTYSFKYFFRFLITVAISLGLNSLVFAILLGIGISEYICYVVGMSIYTSIFYLISRFYVFKE